MTPGILELKIASTMMAGWVAAAGPVPVPAESIAVAIEGRMSSPVEVKLYDENLRVAATVVLERDGSADPATREEITKLFHCRKSGRTKPIAQATLALLADVADRYEGKTIEFVSVYRATRSESRTSPHRAARAIDFRIRGIALRDLRDYLWRRYHAVGIGWYPGDQFIHMDTRPGRQDMSWTFVNGDNRYHPYWAALARRPEKPRPRPGV
jgi:uncharacterized protein YcbK (DUF882 family)